MAEEFGGEDPVIRRLQQAFAHEEPATELAAVLERAARYQAGRSPANAAALAPRHHLTQADPVAARDREAAALTRIYTAYAPALFRFFMAAVGDRHQAEDLTGTAFVSAIEALPRFRGPIEALGGWLFQIARHDLYDHRRKQARSIMERLDGDQAADAAQIPLSPREREVLGLVEVALDHGRLPYPQDPVIERLESGRVVAAMRQLSPDQREVLLLRMAGGLTAPEVAEALGKTTGAVKALQHRGLASLARILGREDAAPSSEHAASDPDT
jgi:RNA polymerase sigma-70 factor, ECF subfamily